MSTFVIHISESTGLPFTVLRQRVPLHLTGAEVKALITDAGEFLWLPTEYELYNSETDAVIAEDVALEAQGVSAGYLLSSRIGARKNTFSAAV